MTAVLSTADTLAALRALHNVEITPSEIDRDTCQWCSDLKSTIARVTSPDYDTTLYACPRCVIQIATDSSGPVEVELSSVLFFAAPVLSTGAGAGRISVYALTETRKEAVAA